MNLRRKEIPLFPGRILLSVCMLLLLNVPLTTLLAAGQAAFPVLMEPVDPRALALGGALLSETEWVGGVLLNPASAAGSSRSLGATYASHMVDMWSGRIVFSEMVYDMYTVGGYLTTFNYGELDVSEIGYGKTGEKFRSSENVFVGFGAGRINERIAWGGAVKFIWGTIDPYDASGLAVDFGLTFDSDWQDLKFGWIVRNWGKQLNGYGSEKDRLPTETAFGITRQLEHLPLTLSTAFILGHNDEGDWNIDFLPGEPGFYFAVGGEFAVYSELLKDEFNLRIGYRSRGEGLRVGQENDLLAGISLGIGIPIKRYTFEYAYATLGALGSIHRFGISGVL